MKLYFILVNIYAVVIIAFKTIIVKSALNVKIIIKAQIDFM